MSDDLDGFDRYDDAYFEGRRENIDPDRVDMEALAPGQKKPV